MTDTLWGRLPWQFERWAPVVCSTVDVIYPGCRANDVRTATKLLHVEPGQSWDGFAGYTELLLNQAVQASGVFGRGLVGVKPPWLDRRQIFLHVILAYTTQISHKRAIKK